MWRCSSVVWTCESAFKCRFRGASSQCPLCCHAHRSYVHSTQEKTVNALLISRSNPIPYTAYSLWHCTFMYKTVYMACNILTCYRPFLFLFCSILFGQSAALDPVFLIKNIVWSACCCSVVLPVQLTTCSVEKNFSGG